MYTVDDEIAGVATRCARCGHRMTYGNREAIVRVVGLALTSFVLMGIALFLPFLKLSTNGRNQSASLVEVVTGFTQGVMLPLAFVVLAFIIFLPLTRFFLLVYALGPVALGGRKWQGAAPALRVAIALRPWAMAEIFMVGVAVALVKLTGLATIDVGPGFWLIAAAVLITAYQETLMCRHTLWTELDRA